MTVQLPDPPIPGEDPSDCRHGCNGDCLEGGSDVCTFTCHPTTEEQA